MRTHAVSHPLVLSLDVGTSSARALLFDDRGNEVEGAGAQVAVTWTPVDGGFEADPDALFDRVTGLIDRAAHAARTAGLEVAAVAVATFWHSLLGVSADGRPLTPLLPWVDGRSRLAARDLRASLDERAVHARTGARLHPSYPPAKLLWLRSAHPDQASGVRLWLSFGEYLLLRVFGRTHSHLSMASGMGLLDLQRKRWDPEVTAAVGVGVDALPALADTGQALRGLRDPYASRWPALAACPWFGPFGDGACSNVGVGCLDRDRLAVMVGTSGAMRVAWTGEDVTVPWGLWCYRVDGARFVMGGALSNGGNLHDWMHRTLALSPREAEVERDLAAVPPDGHGLTMLPFWAGERNPDWPDDARGMVAGLTLQTRPAEILRAALEAVAYRFAALYALLRPQLASEHQIIATGQALLRSPVWMQILADVLEHPLDALDVREGTSRGAALLALEALGLLPDAAAAPMPPGTRYEPGSAVATYRDAIARHQGMYDRFLSAPPDHGGRDRLDDRPGEIT